MKIIRREKFENEEGVYFYSILADSGENIAFLSHVEEENKFLLHPDNAPMSVHESFKEALERLAN
jgi:hypothetical protein